MKRHLLLLLFRVLLSLGVVYALPFSHAQWGEEYPGDGQEGFAFIIIFLAIGCLAALFYLVVGSIGQHLWRRRPARVTVIVDAVLFAVLAALLVYGGVTATYQDSGPGPAAEDEGV
jgi:hypothetical protein